MLANYDFRIFYKSGKCNVEADVLSRIPRTGDILIDASTVKAIISAVPHTDHTDYNYNPSNIVCKSTQVVVHKKSRDDWRVEQENDLSSAQSLRQLHPKSLMKVHLVMRVEGCYAIKVDCCSDMDCCTGKCFMDNCKRINSSLYYLNPTGSRL